MDNEDRIASSLQNIQTSISDMKLSIGVLVTKQGGIAHKLERGVGRIDGHGERLCSIESAQERHSSLFNVLGAGMVACVGIVVTFFSGK